MSKAAAMVTFKAKAGHGNEVARLIQAALPHAREEQPMLLWLVLQSESDPDTVHIVDVFEDPEGRQAHLQAATAQQILATVPSHLACPLDIIPMALWAAKGLD